MRALIEASLSARRRFANDETFVPRDALLPRLLEAGVGTWIAVDETLRIAVTGFRRRSTEDPIRMLSLLRNAGKQPRSYVVTVTFADAEGNELWAAANERMPAGAPTTIEPNAATRLDWELPFRAFSPKHAVFRFRDPLTHEPLATEVRVAVAGRFRNDGKTQTWDITIDCGTSSGKPGCQQSWHGIGYANNGATVNGPVTGTVPTSFALTVTSASAPSAPRRVVVTRRASASPNHGSGAAPS